MRWRLGFYRRALFPQTMSILTVRVISWQGKPVRDQDVTFGPAVALTGRGHQAQRDRGENARPGAGAPICDIRLGLKIGALTPAGRNVDDVVELMLDATQNYTAPKLTKCSQNTAAHDIQGLVSRGILPRTRPAGWSCGNPCREADNDIGFRHRAAELHVPLRPNKCVTCGSDFKRFCGKMGMGEVAGCEGGAESFVASLV